MNFSRKISHTILFFSIESFLFLIWMILIPHDTSRSFLFGFSIQRLLMMSLIIMGGIFFLIIFINIQFRKSLGKWLENITNRQNLFNRMFPITLFISLLVWSSTYILYGLNLAQISDMLYVRLLPFLSWLVVIAWQFLFLSPLVLVPRPIKKISVSKLINREFLWIFACILLEVVLVIIFKLGDPPRGSWTIDLGVPLLEGQILYVIGLAASLVWFNFFASRFKLSIITWLGRFNKKFTLIICSLIWLVAVVLWLSQPLPRFNFFAPRQYAPNFENYPYSDAAQYDSDAYRLIYGTTHGEIITKPLFVTYLAGLHLIGGYQYANMIILQTLILAILPVIIYLIGIELDLPLAGFLAAIFVILRELNSIQAMDYANVSNSKLLLSEPITTLLISLLTYLTIRWMKGRFLPITAGMIIGGLIGLISLVRMQSLMLFPLIIIIACIVYFRRRKFCGQFVLIFFLSTICIILPTIIRSGIISGYYWLESPIYVDKLSEFYGQSGSLLNGIIDNMVYIIHHFTRNTISSFLVFPMRLNEVKDVCQLFRIGDPFWTELPSGLTVLNAITILLNIAIISLGFSIIWRKNQIYLVLLILIYIFFNLSSSLFRLSGWRYILPIDWIIIFFYSIGLAGILQHFLCPQNRESTHKELVLGVNRLNPKILFKCTGIWIFMLIMSIIIPLREILIPSSFNHQSKNDICNEVITDSTFINNEIESKSFMYYCLSEDTQVLRGLAFYPRFIEKEQFLTSRPSDIIYGPQSYSRLTFRLLGYDLRNVFIRQDRPPEIFPNRSEVVVIGRLDSEIEAKYVLLKAPEKSELYVSQ